MREIVFDTETTGIMPGEGHRIVEIGAVELVNRVMTGRTYQTYLDPCRPMPKDAQNVHGLSSDFLTGQPVFEMVIDDFLAFIGDAPLVAHNAAFDMEFLNWELKRAKRTPLPMSRSIDTLEISRKLHPGAKHTLDALCNRYGIDLSARQKHGALLDAELLARVYVELMGGRQIGFDLAVESETEAMDFAAPVAVHPSPRAAVKAVVSADELERHRAFVAGLKDPVWLR
ncbi:MAG: DNA polymerase III subunit epsilon [Polymorphobacter sp.]|uniref:DNA polymerase III subunit epsilon n=1 Tax=Polymorphobacter sp. TaxID=1909290 RepID=UPI003A838BBF